MGVFNLFNRDQGSRNEQTRMNASYTSQINDKNGPVAVFSPTKFSYVELIIDCIKSGKNTVVHLTQLKTESAIRVIDMLSGAIYALGGGVYEMEKNIFMFSPSGVELL